MSISVSRRSLLAAFLSAPAATLLGCGGSLGSSLPAKGSIVGTSAAIGHRLREGFRPQPQTNAWRKHDVVIVGGGMAGLAAAWRLQALGITDFVVLELEDRIGGTSAFGEAQLAAYPWGAHYVPAPMQQNRALIALFNELELIEDTDEAGDPIIGEQFLCRDPEERLYFNGTWHRGLYPFDDDAGQLEKFEQEVEKWVDWRDAQGRRAFTLPTAACSDDSEVRALDELSMAEWLAERDLNSPRLQWLINYCCKDDYGLTAEQTSAWAGLFYFASRVPKAGSESRPLVTFPEGNGRFVRHFREKLTGKVKTGMAVSEIRYYAASELDPANTRSPRREVIAVSHDGASVQGYRARSVIFAAPQFLAPYLIPGMSAARQQVAQAFQYGTWMVANLHLNGRPAENGIPLAWDNVLYDSKSLGYVVATHQRNLEYGPTILTYYHPLCDDVPASARQRLLDLSWEDCAEIVLADLQTAHREIRGLTTQLDVMKWGHAMIRPRRGFLFGPARKAAARPLTGIHFANTDLSGIALLEEALHHGVRAAEEVATERGFSFDSLA